MMAFFFLMDLFALIPNCCRTMEALYLFIFIFVLLNIEVKLAKKGVRLEEKKL